MPESLCTMVTAVAMLEQAGPHSPRAGTLRFVISCCVVPTPKALVCCTAELLAAAPSMGRSLLLRSMEMWSFLLQCWEAESGVSWSIRQSKVEIKGCKFY